MSEHEQWSELGQQLRVDSVRAAAAAGSGHPTSSMSAADLMAVLLSKYLRYDFDRPTSPLNDHLIFSKGHASPLLYSLYGARHRPALLGQADRRADPESKRPRRPARSSWPSRTTIPRAALAMPCSRCSPTAARVSRIVTLAVRTMPTSGTPAELLAQAGIDRAHVIDAVRVLVGQRLAST